MFKLTVETEFAAAHAIVMQGRREPMHGHNWRVTLTVAGPRLDDDGLLCDFHAVEAALRDAVGPLHNGDLNQAPAMADVNPTAENVARRIAELVDEALAPDLPDGVHIAAVRVTEAPGCAATYRPERG